MFLNDDKPYRLSTVSKLSQAPAAGSSIAPAWYRIGTFMSNNPSNAPPAAPHIRGVEPDAHGQAALLLAESILHALVESKVLTTAGALSVIQTTCEVKIEVAEATGESQGRMKQSLALLQTISASFAVDAEFSQ